MNLFKSFGAAIASTLTGSGSSTPSNAVYALSDIISESQDPSLASLTYPVDQYAFAGDIKLENQRKELLATLATVRASTQKSFSSNLSSELEFLRSITTIVELCHEKAKETLLSVYVDPQGLHDFMRDFVVSPLVLLVDEAQIGGIQTFLHSSEQNTLEIDAAIERLFKIELSARSEADVGLAIQAFEDLYGAREQLISSLQRQAGFFFKKSSVIKRRFSRLSAEDSSTNLTESSEMKTVADNDAITSILAGYTAEMAQSACSSLVSKWTGAVSVLKTDRSKLGDIIIQRTEEFAAKEVQQTANCEAELRRLESMRHSALQASTKDIMDQITKINEELHNEINSSTNPPRRISSTVQTFDSSHSILDKWMIEQKNIFTSFTSDFNAVVGRHAQDTNQSKLDTNAALSKYAARDSTIVFTIEQLEKLILAAQSVSAMLLEVIPSIRSLVEQLLIFCDLKTRQSMRKAYSVMETQVDALKRQLEAKKSDDDHWTRRLAKIGDKLTDAASRSNQADALKYERKSMDAKVQLTNCRAEISKLSAQLEQQKVRLQGTQDKYGYLIVEKSD